MAKPAGPVAWGASDIRSKEVVTLSLERGHVRELLGVIKRSKQLGRPTEVARAHDTIFSTGASVASLMRAAHHELTEGLGIVVLRGLPFDDEVSASAVLWALGLHLGRATSQSRLGDRIGEVKDAGSSTNERGYRTTSSLGFHTDSDDFVACLCVRPGEHGGASQFASSLALHTEFHQQYPRLLRILTYGFHYHHRGEEPPGEPPITSYRVPVFGKVGSTVSCVYLRDQIELAVPETRQLTDVELEALDTFDSLANSEHFKVEFTLDAGEAYLINNWTTVHARSDYRNGRISRLLLRLWLKSSVARPVVPEHRRFYGDDGITPGPPGASDDEPANSMRPHGINLVWD